MATRKVSAASVRRRGPVRRQAGVRRQQLPNTHVKTLLLLSSLFLVVMLALAIWGDHGVLKMWHKQAEIRQLAAEITTIEQENKRLEGKIDRLQNDMHYIEKIAREELGLVRPGELVFEFVE